MNRRDVLVSGGGIAGLTLAILLKQHGYEPQVIERAPAPAIDGPMMNFFGTGWDVAVRMGLADDLRAIRTPIDALEFVDADGHARMTVPMGPVHRALDGKYAHLRRSDLTRVLLARAQAAGVAVRFGTSIRDIRQDASRAEVTFEDGSSDAFALVVGADGIHSRVRELLFGPERRFDRFLDCYIAVLDVANPDSPAGRSLQLFEEPNRMVGAHPLGGRRRQVTYVFRHSDVGPIHPEERLAFVRENFRGAGWIAERVLHDGSARLIYFDPATLIRMPAWHHERTVLIGDACGGLTMPAGQGSHMAMASAYVLAHELERHGDDHLAAFSAYEALLKPHVTSRQQNAAWLSRIHVPAERPRPALRSAMTRVVFSAPLARFAMMQAGAKSMLAPHA